MGVGGITLALHDIKPGDEIAAGPLDENFKYLNQKIVSHEAERVSYVVSAVRDMSLDGEQVITLPFKAKSIIVFALKNNTQLSSEGVWGSNGISARYMQGGQNPYLRSTAGGVVMIHDGTNTFHAPVQNVTESGFTLNWIKGGSPTGTVSMIILATTHGEG